MIVYVVNLDSEPERWEAMQEHLATFGLEVRRWAALPSDHIVVDSWSGHHNVPDPARRVAITRTYRALLEHLDRSGEWEWVILQDDMRLRELPHRTSTKDLHLYSGYKLRRYRRNEDGHHVPVVPNEFIQVDPFSYGHVCPRAFRLNRDIIPSLLFAWQDETRQICESWTPYLNIYNASYDKTPTAEEVA